MAVLPKLARSFRGLYQIFSHFHWLVPNPVHAFNWLIATWYSLLIGLLFQGWFSHLIGLFLHWPKLFIGLPWSVHLILVSDPRLWLAYCQMFLASDWLITTYTILSSNTLFWWTVFLSGVPSWLVYHFWLAYQHLVLISYWLTPTWSLIMIGLFPIRHRFRLVQSHLCSLLIGTCMVLSFNAVFWWTVFLSVVPLWLVYPFWLAYQHLVLPSYWLFPNWFLIMIGLFPIRHRFRLAQSDLCSLLIGLSPPWSLIMIGLSPIYAIAFDWLNPTWCWLLIGLYRPGTVLDCIIPAPGPP
jgi:hypothetical protein